MHIPAVRARRRATRRSSNIQTDASSILSSSKEQYTFEVHVLLKQKEDDDRRFKQDGQEVDDSIQ
jgi:hypothetical protein